MKLNNILVVIFLILITIGSSIPGKNMPALNIFRFDKILHLMEYFILGYLLMNVFRDKTDYPKLLTLFIGFMYGVSALGKKGGDHTISILKAQLKQVMEQMCCENTKDLTKRLIR